MNKCILGMFSTCFIFSSASVGHLELSVACLVAMCASILIISRSNYHRRACTLHAFSYPSIDADKML